MPKIKYSSFKFEPNQELILHRTIQGQKSVDILVVVLTQRSESSRDSGALYDVQEIATGERYPVCEHRLSKPIKPYRA